MPSAYLLVSHGSHDPRPVIAMQQLAALVSQKVHKDHNYQRDTVAGNVALLPKSEMLVGTAYLELNPEPLQEQIKKFVKTNITQGYNCLKIIPLFLLPGVHVMEDIPTEVLLAKQGLGEDIMINIQPYLGSHPGLGGLLEKQVAATNAQARIFLAHGSRRLLSHNPVEALAMRLKAVPAYWSVAPSLESRVKELVIAGYRKIAIVPYFLFAGGITDAIARKQQELELQFPEVSFQRTEPLGASPELAALIWDLIKR